jgi:hypothetical protein
VDVGVELEGDEQQGRLYQGAALQSEVKTAADQLASLDCKV